MKRLPLVTVMLIALATSGYAQVDIDDVDEITFQAKRYDVFDFNARICLTSVPWAIR